MKGFNLKTKFKKNGHANQIIKAKTILFPHSAAFVRLFLFNLLTSLTRLMRVHVYLITVNVPWKVSLHQVLQNGSNKTASL